MISIEEYLEPAPFRFVGLSPNPPAHSTQNGLLFTATAKMLGFPVDINTLAFDCLNENGTFNRYPGCTDLESWDDLIGIAATADYFFVKNVLRGGGFWGYFNNTKTFTWAGFLYRRPGLYQHFKVCLNLKLNLFDKVESALSLLLVIFAKPGDTSGKGLDYIAIRKVVGKYWLIDQAIRVWCWQVSRQNVDMHGVYSIYYGPLHPITLAAKDLGPLTLKRLKELIR